MLHGLTYLLHQGRWKLVPTLKAFSLHVHGDQQTILAGDAVVISPGGSILTSIGLPAPPTHALVCDDFSNDGLTDIILMTSNGIYGFVQTTQPGALFFSTLVGCLIVVMGIIFVTQHLNSVKANFIWSEVKLINLTFNLLPSETTA